MGPAADATRVGLVVRGSATAATTPVAQPEVRGSQGAFEGRDLLPPLLQPSLRRACDRGGVVTEEGALRRLVANGFVVVRVSIMGRESERQSSSVACDPSHT